MHLPSLSTGFCASAVLIIAIGAQNAFIIRHALRGGAVLPVVLLCAAADLALIVLGVTGFGAVLAAHPAWLQLARWAGALFLLGYGALALRRAWQGGDALALAEGRADATPQALAKAAGFTFLNPHAYLDTVVLLGTLGAAQPADGQGLFILGAALASCSWFLTLGFGARQLAPLFERPAAWRLLDAGVGAMMLVLAAGLAR
ncbi:MAG: LysE family transporter [Verrucomicrobia bacterium]|nr:LysE family transporter [Verrucomicrobiota bacterium]